MASVLITGGTGMVGSIITSLLRNSSSTHVSSIDILSRRPPPTDSTSNIKFNAFTNADTTTWPPHITSLSPPPSIYFSALATTRAAAGGFDKQYKLEHDFNLELARAAKDAGVKTYVLISSAGASTASSFGYPRMKGEIEEGVKALDFDHTIIVRPGLISGTRQESRPAEAVIRGIAAVAGKISTHYLKDFWAQDADIIAKAAVRTALMADKGEIKEKVILMAGSDIIKHGRTEWTDLK